MAEDGPHRLRAGRQEAGRRRARPDRRHGRAQGAGARHGCRRLRPVPATVRRRSRQRAIEDARGPVGLGGRGDAARTAHEGDDPPAQRAHAGADAAGVVPGQRGARRARRRGRAVGCARRRAARGRGARHLRHRAAAGRLQTARASQPDPDAPPGRVHRRGAAGGQHHPGATGAGLLRERRCRGLRQPAATVGRSRAPGRPVDAADVGAGPAGRATGARAAPHT